LAGEEQLCAFFTAEFVDEGLELAHCPVWVFHNCN
jgi:hypothetical protein